MDSTPSNYIHSHTACRQRVWDTAASATTGYITLEVDVCVTALCSSSKMRPQLSILFLIAFLSFLFTGASQAAQDVEKQPEMPLERDTRLSLCLHIVQLTPEHRQ